MFQVVCVFLLQTTISAGQTGSAVPSVVRRIGVGYNLLYGNPDGTHWKSGGEDPGLLVTRHILDLEYETGVPEQVVYEHHDTCLLAQREELIYSPKSYQEELWQSVTLSGNQVKEVTDLAFTLSSGYTAISKETLDQHYVVQDSSATCTYGTARYKLSLVDLNNYQLSNEFVADVCNLPELYEETSYIGFIDSWGTHILTGMKIGTWRTNRTIGNLRDYVMKILKTAPDDVNVIGPPTSSRTSYVVDYDSLKLRPDFPVDISGTVYNLEYGMSGGSSNLEPVQIELTSIDVALTPNFWHLGNEYCSSLETSGALTARRNNLLQALARYGSLKGASAPYDQSLSMPVDWPIGTFGLPKPTSGCPDQNHTSRWLEGWLKQNPERQDPDSGWNVSHLAGSLTRTLFSLEFCINPDLRDDFSLDWPAGDYCIFKYHDCPTGFSEGFVQWDDEDTDNTNAHGGVLPDGTYGTNTKMKYCCRADGETYNPIILPSESPFYLFQYKHGCQQVHGMTTVEEYIHWDDDDKPSPTGAIGDVHPGMVFTHPPHGTTVYYCYYEIDQSSASIIVG